MPINGRQYQYVYFHISIVLVNDLHATGYKANTNHIIHQIKLHLHLLKAYLGVFNHLQPM